MLVLAVILIIHINGKYLSSPGAFPYLDHVPHAIRRFIIGWNDVHPDGNCGFRCVADAFHQEGQNDWARARTVIRNELAANWPTYSPIYGGPERIAMALTRITHRAGGCGQDHWFQTIVDMFPVACAYNCAVILYTVGESGSLYGCCTVLPLRGVGEDDGPSRELHIVHIPHPGHYVRLFLKPESPMPPLASVWFENRNHEVVAWEVPYARRFAAWSRIYAAA
jgi:hypothetical protein